MINNTEVFAGKNNKKASLKRLKFNSLILRHNHNKRSNLSEDKNKKLKDKSKVDLSIHKESEKE